MFSVFDTMSRLETKDEVCGMLQTRALSMLGETAKERILFQQQKTYPVGGILLCNYEACET